MPVTISCETHAWKYVNKNVLNKENAKSVGKLLKYPLEELNQRTRISMKASVLLSLELPPPPENKNHPLFLYLLFLFWSFCCLWDMFAYILASRGRGWGGMYQDSQNAWHFYFLLPLAEKSKLSFLLYRKPSCLFKKLLIFICRCYWRLNKIR